MLKKMHAFLSFHINERNLRKTNFYELLYRHINNNSHVNCRNNSGLHLENRIIFKR